MENITFEGSGNSVVRHLQFAALLLTFGLNASFSIAATNTIVEKRLWNKDKTAVNELSNTSLWKITGIWNPFAVDSSKTDVDGDGVSCEKENEDGTDPNDPCDFILEHQDCSPSEEWKKEDCDGDGVTNGQEKEDGTHPLDPCDFVMEHQDCSPSEEWKKEDCDGDGVSNGQEKEDGTDPLDPCDFVLENQDCSPSDKWKKDDCDGDGVSNGQEKEDGTDPLDPCDFVMEHQDCSPSEEWKKEDCDGDGVSNGQEKEDGTDPLDPCDFVLENQDCSPSDKWKKDDCDGDGVSNGQEKEDGTDPLDPCDFILENQDCTPSEEWKKTDCDGDGVTNGDEKEDGTDPLDPCDYNPESVTLPQSGDYLTADCDGDGVTNENENEDGTDPLDPCDFVLDSQSVDPSSTWNTSDCDGDGVTNGDEKEDGTDPLDPCDYNPDSVTLPPSADWKALDCDDDGNPNGTDPDPLVATARDDSGSTPALTEVAINVLENDDYLPNNDENNLGVTNLTRIGGDALGTVSFDAETGFMRYTPVESESNTTVSVVYQVCNVLPDPSVCASATVYIQVGPNVIDAVDDAYAAEGDGAIPGSNVLSNDTLNGEALTLTDVILTSTPTDVLTINEDGSVSVAPDTAEGTYTIDYTICEIANVDNCDTATVTVEVSAGMANVIDAVDDAYTAEGDGAIPGSNVLSNDTLNGEALTLTDVILTSTPTDVLTINEDGSVSVAPGTAEGTYTIDYTICEIANVDNCDTATVTVEVSAGMANVIDAVDDAYTAEGDGAIPGSNVLDNDTLNGEALTLTDVILTSTPTDVLTINEDGSVSVAPGTAEGTYTIDYAICEIANVDNCDTATVTVEVSAGMANVIDAVDDAYTAEGDGAIPGSNVLDNDTLNGEAVTLEDVILTSTPTDVLTINEDGSVSVAPDTAEGTYTIDYAICEIDNVDNCDTATVTVEVSAGMANVIDAVDDSYTANGETGGTITDSNVLSNDTLNGEAVTLEDVILTSTPTDVLTINEDGSVSVVPGTAEGTYTIDYTICEIANVDNCDTATVTVEVSAGMANVIDAVDDAYTAEGDGAIPGSNVLDNDTLNGEAVTLEDVILTSIPTDVLTINEDGSVSVAPDTAEGTYTIDYTICEIANVDNCDTATVTVEVSAGMANVIDAVDDAYTAEGDGAIPGSNVLDNDTLNGEAVTLEDVILTSIPTDVLTINEDGSVSVAPDTAEGTYTIDYTICEIANVDNCDTATVTVEVSAGMANVIDAVDDSYTANGETGGTITNSNVLSNDTLNGEALTLTDVILTSTPTDVLTINEDGSVSVAPGTEPDTYIINYTICEASNGNNCDTATVTVIVDNIEVNQMLTPNGDLKNDFLFIRGVNYIKSSTIKIFNRWGALVYEGKDYDNVKNVFDGRVRGKSALNVNDYLPAGVYFYIFNYETDEGSFTDSEYIYISR